LTRIGKGSRFVEYSRSYFTTQGCELFLWPYSFADAKLILVKWRGGVGEQEFQSVESGFAILRLFSATPTIKNYHKTTQNAIDKISAVYYYYNQRFLTIGGKVE